MQFVAKKETRVQTIRSKSIHNYCSSVLVLISQLLICVFFSSSLTTLAFPQQCHYQGEQYQCGTGMGCWMQGMRPVDLCSGGVMWSCCVPHSVPASPAGILHEPGKWLSVYIYHLCVFNPLIQSSVSTFHQKITNSVCCGKSFFKRRRDSFNEPAFLSTSKLTN